MVAGTRSSNPGHYRFVLTPYLVPPIPRGLGAGMPGYIGGRLTESRIPPGSLSLGGGNLSVTQLF